MSEQSGGGVLRSPEFDKSRVDLTLRFDPHVTKRDFEGLEDDLRRGGFDIYIPEMVGRRTVDEDMFRKLARGDTKTYQGLLANIVRRGMADSIYAAQFGALFNTHINMFFADSTEAQVKEDPELGEFGQPVSISGFNSFEGYLDTCLERTKVGARLLQKRDSNIAGNIDSEMGPFIEQHPRLRELDQVKVLVTMGDMHSFLLPGLLEAKGFRPKVSGRPEIQDLTAGEEAEVHFLRGEDIDRRLLLETAANGVLWSHVYHPLTSEKRKIMRHLTNTLSEDVIKDIFDNYRNQGTPWVHTFIRDCLGKLSITDPEISLVDPNRPSFN